MCQNNEDDINSVLESKPDFKKYQKCLKCDQTPVVVTRVSEALCKPCFMEYFVHKFRATVGKNVKKLLERDELVLFAYSASGSSVAMLNLLAKGVGEEAKKKFTFQPVVLYIEDKVLFDPTKSQTDRIESLKEIKKTCDYSNFKIYFSLFENCLLGDDSTSQESLFTDEIEKLEFNSDRTKQFLDLVNESSNGTSREELLKRLKLKLINNVAKRLKISKIMLATNCTKLTIDLLNNVSIGKGAHVSWETSLEEKRPDGILYLRPFRELTSKEIAFYNHFIGKNDSILSNNSSLMNLPNSTIYRLTEKFICGLQSDYPSTVSTLFRTSDKLTPCDDLIDCNHMCCLCESPLDTNSSAIDDLEFSRSLAKLSLNNNITEDFSIKDENHNLSEFCYSCSVIIGDLKKKQNLPLYLKEKLRENMKSKINDCLIQD